MGLSALAQSFSFVAVLVAGATNVPPRESALNKSSNSSAL